MQAWQTTYTWNAMHSHIFTVASTAFRLKTVATLQEPSLLSIAPNMLYELYARHMSSCVWIWRNCGDYYIDLVTCHCNMVMYIVVHAIPNLTAYTAVRRISKLLTCHIGICHRPSITAHRTPSLLETHFNHSLKLRETIQPHIPIFTRVCKWSNQWRRV